MNLTVNEQRVLGCLVEKAMTTPDYYPLTQNALQNACNQSTSRDPVLALTDGEVIQAVNGLRDRGLVRAVHSPGQRAVKYRHVLDEALDLDAPSLALLAVLLLRGSQTPGELRSRTGRYHEFASSAEVVARLDVLAARPEPLVVRLGRRPGEKEDRWAHVLSEASAPETSAADVRDGGREPAAAAPAATAATSTDAAPAAAAEIAALRDAVADLRRRVAALEAELGMQDREGR